jgi:hypothetical protein
MNNVLDTELAFFEQRKTEWEKVYLNKFVLVKDRELINTFDTADAAVAEGARRYGATSFLVKKVSQTEESMFIPSLSLGLLYATN